VHAIQLNLAPGSTMNTLVCYPLSSGRRTRGARTGDDKPPKEKQEAPGGLDVAELVVGDILGAWDHRPPTST
jgi:hypothetical protein